MKGVVALATHEATIYRAETGKSQPINIFDPAKLDDVELTTVGAGARGEWGEWREADSSPSYLRSRVSGS